MEHRSTDILIIGAGLTGLTTGFWLTRAGKNIHILEKSDRVGGQIHTFREKDFVYESGPNTGVVSYPEVAELFAALSPACKLETAREESKRRLIWKGDRFRALPSGLFSAITTPLFTLGDKFRILGEPLRAKGNNPDESVGELAARRLGQSFLHYAVDPFLSGVYAGDPMKLVTRYALPKLYNLEQQYGGFIRGTIAKARQPKTSRDRLATKKVFSATGGLDRLTGALADAIGAGQITLSAANVTHPPLYGQMDSHLFDSRGRTDNHCPAGGHHHRRLYIARPAAFHPEERWIGSVTCTMLRSYRPVSASAIPVGCVSMRSAGLFLPARKRRARHSLPIRLLCRTGAGRGSSFLLLHRRCKTCRPDRLAG